MLASLSRDSEREALAITCSSVYLAVAIKRNRHLVLKDER